MMTCSLCGGTVNTCASCRGSCAAPVCHVCRDSDPSAAHAGTASGPLTISLSTPVVLV